VAQQQAGPTSVDDPLDSVLARLEQLHKKQRTPQPPKKAGAKPPVKRISTPSGSTPTPSQDASSRPNSRGLSGSSSSSSTDRSSSSRTQIQPEMPGPNQESIDAALDAVMTKINGQKPRKKKDAKAAAAKEKSLPKQAWKPTHEWKEGAVKPASSVSGSGGSTSDSSQVVDRSGAKSGASVGGATQPPPKSLPRQQQGKKGGKGGEGSARGRKQTSCSRRSASQRRSVRSCLTRCPRA